jgi:hypothetical protein
MLLLIASLLSLGLCAAAFAMQWTEEIQPGDVSEVSHVVNQR